jgi:hypothetical protein
MKLRLQRRFWGKDYMQYEKRLVEILTEAQERGEEIVLRITMESGNHFKNGARPAKP